MKTLYLVRHAKSSWKNADVLEDIDRPLNERGKRDAPFMGNLLKERGITPDLLISSPAKRARKTAKKIAQALSYDLTQVEIQAAIYESSAFEFLRWLQQLKVSANSLMVFGHNPTFTNFTNYYSPPIIDNVPTCGVVAIEYAVRDWSQVNAYNGQVLFFEYPKKYLNEIPQ